MRIVVNPGLNLSQRLVQHYDIDVMPQHIVVDGESFDTRSDIPLSQVDRWVETAREHPYVLGTSAAEFASFFSRSVAGDPEIVAVMSSRKLIQSFDAARSAARTVSAYQRKGRPVDVRVVDTGATDMGAGLVAILAALARGAGLSVDDIETLLESFAAELRMQLWVATLDGLIKGGRASFLRGFIANLLRIRPVLTLEGGEIVVAAKISTKTDPVKHLTEAIVASFDGRRVWVAVVHGAAPGEGDRLAGMLRDRIDIDYLCVRPFSPSIYLHAGPGSVGAFVAPVDRLPWTPPRPIDP